MNDLRRYFANRAQFIELLKAVDIRTLEQFAVIDPFTVLSELHQARRRLKLRTEIPTAPVFKKWVEQALTSTTAESPGKNCRHAIPMAAPVDGMENEKKLVPPPASPPVGKAPHKQPSAQQFKHLSAKARIQEEKSYQPAKRVHARQERKTYLRKKGIKHMTPFRTWVGAASVLLLFVSILFSIAVTTLVLLNGERGWQIISLCFGPWLLSLILYFSLSLPRKCSVCRVRIFSFKKYTRNKATHQIPLFGYVFATALHIFLFRWFRCPACGSSQQLEKNGFHPCQEKH